MVIIGIIHSEKTILDQALELLDRSIGPTRLLPEQWPFDWSDYYVAEMGRGLVRRFVVCQRLFNRDALVELKLITNRIEDRLADAGGNRRINLDPGLLSLENFVLASTKGQPQRVYLRRGIWAESTLWFIRGDFVPHRRTYPDYRDEGVQDLLKLLRLGYKERLDESESGVAADELDRLLKEDFN